MSSNAIFYDNRRHYAAHSLKDGIDGVLAALSQCIASTKRVADRSPSHNFKKGVNCLHKLYEEIDGKVSGPTFKQTSLGC